MPDLLVSGQPPALLEDGASIREALGSEERWMRLRKTVTWLATASLTVGLSGMATLVAAPPAFAVPGLTTVTLTSAVDSAAVKTVTPTCPAGTTVIGGGGHIVDSPFHLQLTGLRPVVTVFGSGYQVTATEDESGVGGNWRLRAYAVCAPAPAGLQYRWTVTQSSSQSFRDVAVHCPEGRKVLGTGAVISGGGQQVGLRRIRPTATLTTVIGGAHEDATGYGGSWSLTGWAVCAYPPRGLALAVDSTDAEGFTANSAQAECPAPKRVHGVGGMVTGPPDLPMRGAFPYQSDTAFVQGAVSGYDGPWGVHAYAICAY